MYDQHELAQAVVTRRAGLLRPDTDREESAGNSSSRRHLVLGPRHPHLLDWHEQPEKTIPQWWQHTASWCDSGSSSTHCFFSIEALISLLWSPAKVLLRTRHRRSEITGRPSMALTHDPSRSLQGRNSPWNRFGIPGPVASWRHLRSHSNNPTDKVCPGRPIGTVGFWIGNITTLCLTYPDHRNPDFIPVESPNL